MEILLYVAGGFTVLIFISGALHYGLMDGSRALLSFFITVLATVWVHNTLGWSLTNIGLLIGFILLVMYNIKDLGLFVFLGLLYLNYQIFFGG